MYETLGKKLYKSLENRTKISKMQRQAYRLPGSEPDDIEELMEQSSKIQAVVKYSTFREEN